MKMKEYGSENHPTILLLCKKEPKNEGWNSLIHALEEQYHILLPSLMPKHCMISHNTLAPITQGEFMPFMGYPTVADFCWQCSGKVKYTLAKRS